MPAGRGPMRSYRLWLQIGTLPGSIGGLDGRHHRFCLTKVYRGGKFSERVEVYLSMRAIRVG